MILNKNNYPCLHDDGSVEYKSNPTVLRESKLSYKYPKFADKNYWYIEILYLRTPTTVYPQKIIENYIPADILQQIISGDVTLIILGVEPVIEVFDDVYQMLLRTKIPEDNVILITELIDINQRLNDYATKYGLKPIKSWYASIDENHVRIKLNKWPSVRRNNKILLPNTPYSKCFINFNRRWRIHRPLFVSLLACKNLLDKGYVSLANVQEGDNNWNSVFNSLLNVVDPEVKQMLIDNKEKIVNLDELLVDTSELVNNQYDIMANNSTIDYYNQTYFSVVSETLFFEDFGRFLTEKTFKPIAFKHPFLLITAPHTLEFLKSRGYKTFHPFIDESYDEVEDNMTRMKMILAETERLCNLSPAQLNDFINGVKPIVEYNYENLIFGYKTVIVSDLNK